MTRVLIYARQSDTDAQGERSLSLDSQESALRERAAREGWRVVGVERDPDIRGWKDETARPGFARVLARAARREFDVLLVWDLSRLARKVEFQERWVRVLGVDGIEIEAHVDPEVRHSPFMRQIKGAVAEEQTRQIAGHVRRALRERTQRGLPHGRAPWGYLRAKPNGALLPDPAVAPIVAALFQAKADGASVRDCVLLAVHLCDQAGVDPPGKSGWYWTIADRILRNPVYRGAVRFGGVVVEDAHPGIVSGPLWHAAQSEAKQYRRRTDPSLSWLAGLIDHACGGGMYLQGPDMRHHFAPWLCCPNLGRGGMGRTCRIHPAQVETPRLEAMTWTALEATIAELVPPEQVAADAKARLAALGPDVAKMRRAAERAKAQAAGRRERAVEAYLAGVIDAPRRDAELARAADELAAADADLAAIPAVPSLAEARATHLALARLRDGLAHVPPSVRAAVLEQIGRAKLLPAIDADPAKRNRGRIVIVPRPEIADYLGGEQKPWR